MDVQKLCTGRMDRALQARLSSLFALLCLDGFHDSLSHPKPMAGLLRKCVS